jgi:hypothetical protein
MAGDTLDPMSAESEPRRPSPAAFFLGPAHVIVHGNRPFVEMFGARSIGQPAREALVDLPAEAFQLMDLVYRSGRSFARQITTRNGTRRLVVAARRDPETGETYGVATHLRPIELPDRQGASSSRR